MDTENTDAAFSEALGGDQAGLGLTEAPGIVLPDPKGLCASDLGEATSFSVALDGGLHAGLIERVDSSCALGGDQAGLGLAEAPGMVLPDPKGVSVAGLTGGVDKSDAAFSTALDGGLHAGFGLAVAPGIVLPFPKGDWGAAELTEEEAFFSAVLGGPQTGLGPLDGPGIVFPFPKGLDVLPDWNEGGDTVLADVVLSSFGRSIGSDAEAAAKVDRGLSAESTLAMGLTLDASSSLDRTPSKMSLGFQGTTFSFKNVCAPQGVLFPPSLDGTLLTGGVGGTFGGLSISRTPLAATGIDGVESFVPLGRETDTSVGVSTVSSFITGGVWVVSSTAGVTVAFDAAAVSLSTVSGKSLSKASHTSSAKATARATSISPHRVEVPPACLTSSATRWLRN